LVHRLGVVGERDVNNGNELVLRLRTIKLFAREVDSGTELEIDKPGIELRAQSNMSIRSSDAEYRFAIQQHVELSHVELYGCVITLFLFGTTLIKALEDLARVCGVRFDAASAIMHPATSA
jgi:hypothetical protein